MDINLEKLEEIFALKYEALQPEQATNSEWWIEYCDGQGIILLHPEWVREEFNKDHKNMVCIHSPEISYEHPLWLLIPKELAVKCLALGGAP